MKTKVSFWKAVAFTTIALIIALVIGYAVHVGHEAFPEGEPIFTTIGETGSYEQESVTTNIQPVQD